MEVDLGELRCIFELESLYGTCTVSLTTLEQSKWKVVYSAALITGYVSQTVYFICSEQSSISLEPISLLTHRVILLILPVHSLIMAIVDHKSKISTALNLQAIERTLENQGIQVPGSKVFKYMPLVLKLSNIILQSYGSYALVDYLLHKEPFTIYVMAFHILGTEVMQGFSLSLFMAKVIMIQRAITKGISEIIQSLQEDFTSPDQQLSNKRTWAFKRQNEALKKRTLLVNLQGSLQYLESTVCSSFWFQVLLYRLIVEVVGLMACVSWIQVSPASYAVYYCVRMTITFLVIVFLIVRMKHEKKHALQAFTTGGLQNHGFIYPNKFKHQILAGIHRNQTSFSCAFFDVDFALLLTVLENAIFVVTSMVGTSASST